MKRYDISMEKAAEMVGFTSRGFKKIIERHPKELPMLVINAGKRPTYRLNRDDVTAFVDRHVVGGE